MLAGCCSARPKPQSTRTYTRSRRVSIHTHGLPVSREPKRPALRAPASDRPRARLSFPTSCELAKMKWSLSLAKRKRKRKSCSKNEGPPLASDQKRAPPLPEDPLAKGGAVDDRSEGVRTRGTQEPESVPGEPVRAGPEPPRKMDLNGTSESPAVLSLEEGADWRHDRAASTEDTRSRAPGSGASVPCPSVPCPSEGRADAEQDSLRTLSDLTEWRSWSCQQSEADVTPFDADASKSASTADHESYYVPPDLVRSRPDEERKGIGASYFHDKGRCHSHGIGRGFAHHFPREKEPATQNVVRHILLCCSPWSLDDFYRDDDDAPPAVHRDEDGNSLMHAWSM